MKLTTSESALLTKHERTIKSTQGAFVACGKALAEIRDQRLYREKHGTFEDYCEAKWGWTRIRAYQLIDAAGVAESLPENVNNCLQNEGQARALAGVSETSRVEVLEKAVATGKVTAKSITAAARKTENVNNCLQNSVDPKGLTTQKPSTNGSKSHKAETHKPEEVLDETGYPVPSAAMEFWNRRGEITEMLAHISKARSAIRPVDPDKDRMFAETNINAVLSHLNQAYTELKTAEPYAVCASCQGQAAKTCTLCRGRGVISKHRWTMAVPEEQRAMREKLSKRKS